MKLLVSRARTCRSDRNRDVGKARANFQVLLAALSVLQIC